MLLINEFGKIASWKVGECIVSMVGAGDSELGFLNEKSEAFAKSLESLLAQ
jgi:hypothetical protein